MNLKKGIPISVFLLFVLNHVVGQCVDLNASISGDAFLNAEGEYVLTRDANEQAGAIWGNVAVDLNHPFDFNFQLYMGNKNDAGADGAAFVLRAIGTPDFGRIGGGLGYSGISPSFAVEFDTFFNIENGDPVNDHTAIQVGGNEVHSDLASNVLPPIVLGDIEDNTYHDVRFVWAPGANQFSYFFDGVLLATLSYDIRIAIGSDKALWGFTGATAHFFNEQKICAQTVVQSLDMDFDNDGIVNSDECGGLDDCWDTDGDGITDDMDLDSDGDGCFDTIEAGFTDDDGDGILGLSPIMEGDDGLVIGQGGYALPLDQNDNGLFDFQEAASPILFVFEPQDQTVEQGQNVTFSFEASLSSVIDIIWEESRDQGLSWIPLLDLGPYSGTSTNSLTITAVPISSDGYLYRAVLNDSSFLCENSAIAQALLEVLPGLIVPDGFSPNGDAINDVLVIEGIQEFENYSIEIFNRYGTKVFVGNSSLPFWDGTALNSNETLPVGVYFYVLNPNIEGEEAIQGRIHLRR